eukprot:TRINITY_DN19801_c0_g1::TRINITY_DN19801_c0_g1_i1::g.11359::m.11359 TRINITY_DN19801_c0_g1::TRINITY_DN19801_c0_g1_i1::g.11359  ORF type:complete len:157 (-),score=18.93 TRINITY_DN19801_c0_g1_i1:140-610(-)
MAAEKGQVPVAKDANINNKVAAVEPKATLPEVRGTEEGKKFHADLWKGAKRPVHVPIRVRILATLTGMATAGAGYYLIQHSILDSKITSASMLWDTRKLITAIRGEQLHLPDTSDNVPIDDGRFTDELKHLAVRKWNSGVDSVHKNIIALIEALKQ